MVVADSNVWMVYLRTTDSEVGRELDQLLENKRVALTGPILAEILQGTTGERDHARLADVLETVPYLETSREAWTITGRISRELRIVGRPLPLTDIVIAAVAIEGDHELFTLDSDFERIPGLRLYQPQGDV